MKPSHLFLYEYVPFGSKVVLYGLGEVGTEYIWQIEETNWCEIIGVCDKNKRHLNYNNFRIEELNDDRQYDFLIIAVEDKVIATEIYDELVLGGVKQTKIVNLNMRHENFPIRMQTHKQEKDLYILVREGGGLGDTLIDILLIKKMREILDNKGKIFLECNYKQFFSDMDFIDDVYEFQKVIGSSEDLNEYHHWDLVIVMHNYPLVIKADYKKIVECSPLLGQFCREYEELFNKAFSGIANNYRFTKYALLRGKNRIEQLDVFGRLGLSRKERYLIAENENEKDILQKYKLNEIRYITIGRDVGSGLMTHPKLWPIKYYCFMLQEIKNSFPNLTVVYVGNKGCREITELVDIDLTGKTELDEIKAVLRQSVLHIDGEGGLVHLKHFLGGVSAVFFGPTSPENFGYDENINIYTEACKEHCEWLTDDWTEGCLLGYETPICMEKNYAKSATIRIVGYLLERI